MNDLESNRYFHDGKRARTQGRPCQVSDRRLSFASREAWRLGWQEQDDLMKRPTESKKQREARHRELFEGMERIKESLAVLLVCFLLGGVALAEEPPEHLYEYRVQYVSAYDGDTVRLDVDLGFEVWVKNSSFRLLGIDAPELRGAEREAGLEARNALREMLKSAEYLKIRTVKDDKGKFGRWLAEIFVWDGAAWVSVNDELVSRGLAVRKEY